jgi:predicted NAD-dependent protein-ADP-ribosyltransferase YbiA (DUF1768 family)
MLTFYSKSADKYPGNGTDEQYSPIDEDYFCELFHISHWRRMLSNFWIAPFELDGLWWNSVEHAYHASKFREENPDYYYLFSLNSESDICQEPVLAKGAGGKTGKIKGKQYRSKNITVDSGYFEEKRDYYEMCRAQEAKFTQNPELMKMLKLTGSAELFHYMGRGQGYIQFSYLEELRDSE